MIRLTQSELHLYNELKQFEIQPKVIEDFESWSSHSKFEMGIFSEFGHFFTQPVVYWIFDLIRLVSI